MSSGRWDEVVQEIRRIAGLTEAAGQSDGRLLEAFVVGQNPAALEVLVRRYGPMVFGVCRRVLRHKQDAEDAFQATFLVLVRKAATLGRREAVGNWLYGVAYRTALQARTRSARRRQKEAQAPPMDNEDSSLETAARLELQALLDRELNRLPEKYRTPVVLCDLLGKSKRQAAEDGLRVPEGTVSSRLARSREMLKKRLAHHAPAFAEAAPVGLLAPLMTQALPPNLCGATAKAAALTAQGTKIAAAFSPSVAALVQGVMKSMLLTKLKPLAALFLVAGLLSGTAYVVGSGIGMQPASGDMPAPAAEQPRKTKPPEAAPVPPVVVEQVAVQKTKKEQLRYDGKDFNAWRDLLFWELKPGVRIDAMKALAIFGANGYPEEATAALMEVMKKYDSATQRGDQVLRAAEDALANIGPQALVVVARELESKNVNDRRLAISAIGCFDVELVEPYVLHALGDHDSVVRNRALVQFTRKTSGPAKFSSLTLPEKQKIVPALAEALQDADSDIRMRAAKALALFGPDAKSAVPALIKAFKEETGRAEELRSKNKGTAKKGLGPSPTQLENQTLTAIIKAFAAIGPDAREAVPMLILAFRSTPKAPTPDKEIQTAIMKIGPVAIPALTAALENSDLDPNTRSDAARVIGSFGPAAVSAVPALTKCLKDTSLAVRIAAARGLGGVGPKASKPNAVAELIAGIHDRTENNAHVRLEMIRALDRLDPDPDQVVPELEKIFAFEPDKNVVENAVNHVARLGPKSSRAVPALLKLLENQWENKVPFLAVVNALGEIGPAAAEAIPMLNDIWNAKRFGNMQESSLREFRHAAAAALEKIQKK